MNDTPKSSVVLLAEQNTTITNRWKEIFRDEEENVLELKPPLLHDTVDESQMKKYLKEMDNFEKKNKINIDHHVQYHDEYEDYRHEYDNLPKLYNKWFYMFWIVFLVVLEIPTNYTTIEQFLHKPVVSMMVTVAIGSLLVYIAHSHGGFFKQLKFITATADADDNHNVTSRTMRYVISIAGFIGIGVIFYGLYYARLQYFNTISGVDVADPFGDGGENLVAATIFTKVGILMLANFAIYSLGVIGSYVVHDTIPGYQEAYYKMMKYSKMLHKEYMKMKTELDRIAKKVRKRESNPKRGGARD